MTSVLETLCAEVKRINSFAGEVGQTTDYLLGLTDTPTAPAKEDSLSIKAGIAMARSGHKTIGMEPLTPEELSLIEAYRQASDERKGIVDGILKPQVRTEEGKQA